MSLGLEYVPPRNSKAESYQNVAWTCAELMKRSPEPMLPGRVSRHAVALHIISGKLHRLAEAQCNYGLKPRQESAERRLEKAASEIAAYYGMRAYHQGDPRGCSLYLIPAEHPESEDASSYNRGHAVGRYLQAFGSSTFHHTEGR